MAEPSTSTTEHAPLPSDREPLLVVENLKTHFELPAGMVKAVDGVSFVLYPGRTLGVVGESGSGKTVLSRSIMRLNLGDNVHTTGSVEFEGIDLLAVPPKLMPDIWGLDMSMIFQDPMTSLNPVVKIGRQITEHVRRHLGVSKDEAKATALQLLKDVRIPEAEARFNAYPHELSGGMRQRVSIDSHGARVPVRRPADRRRADDRPGCDHTARRSSTCCGRAPGVSCHMAVLLITHDLGVIAETHRRRVAVMYAGKHRRARRATDVRFAEGPEAPVHRGPCWSAMPGDLATGPGESLAGDRRTQVPDLASTCRRRAARSSPRCTYVQPKCSNDVPKREESGCERDQFACWLTVGSAENKACHFDANMAECFRSCHRFTRGSAEGRIVDESVIEAATAVPAGVS